MHVIQNHGGFKNPTGAQRYVREEMPVPFGDDVEKYSYPSSKTEWMNPKKQTWVSPEIESPSRKCFTRRPLCLLCLIITLGLGLATGIGLMIADALALTNIKTTITTITTTSVTTLTTTSLTSTASTLTSSSTTESTSTTATTTPSCISPNASGRIFSFASATAPTTYTLYSYGFIANDSSTTVVFAMTGDSGGAHHYWLLDTVSVIEVNTSTNALINGGFETGDLSGWTQYCATDANCGTGFYGQLTNTTCDAGTYCYMDRCNSGNHFDYLIQSVNTVVGYYYMLEFKFQVFANGGPHLAYVMLQ